MDRLGLVRSVALSLTVALGAGCLDDEVTVMTYNLYVGADIAPILQATSIGEVATRVDEAMVLLETTNLGERVEAIVDQIEAHQPHLIGLQEVSLLRVQSPGDLVFGGTQPATDVLYDYEAILMAELAARGLDYRVAARVQNADVELPRANATFDDVRLTDFDVILARGDVPTTPVLARNYQAAVVVPVPGTAASLTILRGVVAVRAELHGQRALFVNTHLETAAFPLIQVLQAAELLVTVRPHRGTTLLVGDFNSAADGSTTPTYQLIRSAGFVDTWEHRVGAPEPGDTCCQAPDLQNEASLLDERIDLVFGRSLQLRTSQLEIEATVVGDEQGDRTAEGLWPSDHAGVVTTLRPAAAP